MEGIKSWPLDSPVAFKGCCVSPTAKTVIYWTDDQLSFYLPQPTVPHDGIRMPVAATHRLRTSPDRPLQRWRSVSLTDKYLAASTQGSGSFQVVGPLTVVLN